MALQAYQLLRIIIIDSFWKKQVNELDLTGHTQLEGTNGAGKTSLMRLLPLFYGMRPSDIVSKVDQAKNFADYYLPRDTSLLVYEYVRPYGQTCMVLASSDGRAVHYKLIDAAYDSTLFIHENKRLTISEIERNYRNAGTVCSSFLGVDKYRQVIQNLRSGRKIKDVRELQSRFAFSDNAAPHIDKVVNGTIEKNLDFDAVKRMLVEIASDHLARNNIDEKEKISLNKEDISHWLADIQASRAIQKVSDKIALWQTDFTNLDSLLNKLQHLHFEMINHQKSLQEKQQHYQQTKKTTIADLDVLETELKLSSTTFRQDISTLSAKIEADQSRINLLDEDKLNYEDNDAASFQLQADQAPRFQQQLNEVNDVIAAFEGNISKIQSKFEKLIGQVKQQKMVDVTANKEQHFTVKEAASVQLSVISETQQAQLAILNEQLNATNLKLNMQKQALENDVKQVQLQQNNPVLEPELIAAIEENQQNLGLCHETQTLILAKQNEQNGQLNVLETQRTLLLDKHKQEGRYLEKINNQRHEIECQLLPKEGSLQHFLTHQADALSWKDNIGRLLSTEQLNRTDLSPKWAGPSDSFYGLQLDLMQLQENDLQLSENELREKAQVLDVKAGQLTDNITGLENQLNECRKQIQALLLMIAESKQSCKQNELKLEQLKTQKTHLNDKKSRAIKAAQSARDEQLKALFTQQKDNRLKIETFQEQQQDERLALHNAMLEQRMVVESDRDSQLDELSNQLQAIELSASERLRDYKKQHSSALSDLDPDGEVDKRTQDRIELEKALDECAVWSRKAREYAQFMNERYVHRDKLVEVNQNREIEKRGFENSLEDLQSEKGNAINENQKSLKKLNVQLRNSTELLTQLSDSQRLCEKSGISALESDNEPNNEADLTVSFCFDWLKQFEVVEKRLSGQLQRFNETFKKNHASSELFENWQKLVADNDNFQGARNLFKYRDPIMDLLSSAEQKQKNTYQLVTVNANMINEFYQHIENFGRRIKSIGKQLSKSVTALAHFEALADINVYTVMKQEELEYWGPLQQFAKLFEQHRDELREGMGDIPDDLVFAMQKLSSYLPSDGFVLAHHNLFDIEFSISEKGQLKYARNARQLKKISSTGLSYLAMLSLYAGILGMLRGQTETPSNIILPVDELGELAAENVDLLLKMFSDNNICMLSASPSTDRHILSLYNRHYKIKDNKIFHAKIPLSRIDELLALRAQQQQTHEAEATNV
ncbi:ATP-binding protein [Psychromonas sp. Urea-02u-13]|uniref:ATP-binding protein n=1 Tax=Psychromonas sp. Urea-02u-13 TaxID=2058326 RepID=UPI000C34B890|nr:ATP-binding protein [Psychromonas sp. Urea-02u-13]PKG40988.1 ATP-binding protein [Psychromonas sp. Urea-02u-13]